MTSPGVAVHGDVEDARARDIGVGIEDGDRCVGVGAELGVADGGEGQAEVARAGDGGIGQNLDGEGLEGFAVEESQGAGGGDVVDVGNGGAGGGLVVDDEGAGGAVHASDVDGDVACAVLDGVAGHLEFEGAGESHDVEGEGGGVVEGVGVDLVAGDAGGGGEGAGDEGEVGHLEAGGSAWGEGGDGGQEGAA